MAGKGWIKLNREIQEHFLWKSNEPFDKRSAWIDLLLMANHENKKVCMKQGLIVVERGQVFTSIRKLAERWNWSRDKVVRYFALLEQDGMIVRNSDNYRTLLTIVNYGFFQGTQDSSKSTDKSTHKSTDKSTDKSQTRMKKNEKEIKKGIASQNSFYLEDDDEYVSDEEWQKRLAEQDDDW